MTRLLVVMSALCAPAFAVSVAEKFGSRLSSVAFDTTTRAVVVGEGRLEATLEGRTMSVSGSFRGLSSAATKARLFMGAAVGVPGKPIFDLIVSPTTSGRVSGTAKLSVTQASALRGERIYVQIETERAPDGALWGWLMPSHDIPVQDKPEKGPWFLQ
jgi:hypothetical protein